MSDTLAERFRLRPYRVDWRFGATHSFHASQGFDDHDDARAHAEEMVKQWGGESRVITQHIIERVGTPGKRPAGGKRSP